MQQEQEMKKRVFIPLGIPQDTGAAFLISDDDPRFVVGAFLKQNYSTLRARYIVSFIND